MTKAELTLVIEEGLGDGVILSSDLVETIGDVARYRLNVFETGAGDTDELPTALKRTIEIYVVDEGGAGEAAYMMQREYASTVDNAPTGADGLSLVARIFSNADLRNRTQAAVIKYTNSAARRQQIGFAHVNGVAPIDSFMILVAANATVQANGATATDSDLEWIVNDGWDNAAELMGCTV